MFPKSARHATIAAAFVVFGITVAKAQEKASQDKFSLQGQAGVAVPGKQLHQFENAGPNATLDLAYAIRPRLAVEVFGGFSRLNGQTSAAGTAPNLDATDYGVALQGDLIPTAERHWSLLARGGVGASMFRSDQFNSVTMGLTQFKHTYPTATGGLEVGYHFRPRVSAYVGTDLVWAFTKTDDTALFGTMDGSTIHPFSKAWTAPMTLGLQATI
jgi:hypothetical protein